MRTIYPSKKAGGTVGRIGCSIILAVLLCSCGVTPPAQEMSDARQAITAAKQAGAEEHAAEDLHAAEAYLDSAARKLSERAYGSARRDAMLAKERAQQALELSEGDRDGDNE